MSVASSALTTPTGAAHPAEGGPRIDDDAGDRLLQPELAHDPVVLRVDGQGMARLLVVQKLQTISDGGTAADPLRKSTQHNTIELMAVVV